MNVTVRPLAETDMSAAAAINRSAFASFFGIADPAKFRPGADVIRPRWRSWPAAGIALDIDGTLAGVGIMMRWGSVCVLGPLTVDPRHQSKGLARTAMAALLGIADRTGFAFTGLFTHPQSPKHIRLYESFGFAMQRITAVMAKPVAATEQAARPFSAIAADGRAAALADLARVSDRAYPGLDLAAEIMIVAEMRLGETLILDEGAGVAGFAVCHCGTGSEATDGQALVKFAAVRGGGGAPERFTRLLAACEAYAAARGVATLVAGTNTGRTEAYRLMKEYGFRTAMNGIAMFRPATDGYNRPDALVIDDWR